MLVPLVFGVLLHVKSVAGQCQQCGMRYSGYQNYPKRYNFNFDQFFNGRQFNDYIPPRPAQRVFNVYGQDAEAFGSAIGKSIAQRIQQAYAQQSPSSSPEYNLQFTPPTSSATSTSSVPSSPPPPSPSYAPTPSITSQSPYTSSSHSTHPPEDLPTVQQVFQQQYSSYGASTPSMNNFGGLPGMLPPPKDCPWCGGYREKRKGEEETENQKN